MNITAHAVGIYGRARPVDRTGTWESPPSPTDYAATPVAPLAPAIAPEFTQHMEFRSARFPFRTASAAPVAGMAPALTVPATEGWVRCKTVGERRGAAFLAFMIDAWWPALFSLESAPRPMATVAFTFQPLTTEPLDPSAPLFHRARVLAARDGYAVEFRELWTGDGRLVATNQQTFVVIA